MWSSLSEIHTLLQDWKRLKMKEAEANPGWTFLEDRLKTLHSGLTMEGEILVFLTRRIAAGVGTGYIFSEITEDASQVIVQKTLSVIDSAHPASVSALPLIISGSYFLPLKKNISLMVRGGTGLLWAKYVSRQAQKKHESTQYTYPQLHKASSRGPVYVAGLGLAYERESGLYFFLEGTFRKSRITGFSGENKDGSEGTLYAFERYYPALGVWIHEFDILSAPPSGPGFRSAQEAVVDFDGFSVTIGFMIRF